MKKALFVAGLDFSINDDDLKQIFAEYGTVESAKVIMDRETGRSRGFGFVDMSSNEDAANCVQNLNDATVKNRQLVVKFKEDKPANDRRQGGFNKRW